MTDKPRLRFVPSRGWFRRVMWDAGQTLLDWRGRSSVHIPDWRELWFGPYQTAREAFYCLSAHDFYGRDIR